MATILVGLGPKQETFMVHQALLCSKSGYFTKALTGSFKESQTGTVKLEDVSPVLFKIIVSWLYNGKICYAEDGSNINCDFASLEQADDCYDDDDENDEDEDRETMKADDIATWPYKVLAKLYVLADRLDIGELRNNAIDALNTALERRPFECLAVDDCKFVDSNTTLESPLRQFVVDELAYGCLRRPQDFEFWRALPHDIAVGVLMRVGGKVPKELCSTCYQMGLSRHEVVLDDGHPCKNNDKAPFAVDMCIYHDHADDEEKKECQASRFNTADK